jgi:hypothetical protein
VRLLKWAVVLAAVLPAIYWLFPPIAVWVFWMIFDLVGVI